jgi:hypothetical protein
VAAPVALMSKGSGGSSCRLDEQRQARLGQAWSKARPRIGSARISAGLLARVADLIAADPSRQELNAALLTARSYLPSTKHAEERRETTEQRTPSEARSDTTDRPGTGKNRATSTAGRAGSA